MNNLTLASILTVISSLLFFGTTHLTNTQTTRVPDQKHKHLHFQKHIQVVAQSTCEGTLYPDLCVLTLATFPDLTTKSVPQVISSVVNHTMYEVRSTSYNCSGLKKMLKNLNPLDQRALDDCLKLFEDTSVELKATIDDLSIKSTIGSKLHHDLQTLLSGAMTNLYTCLDGFAYSKGRVGDRIEKKLLQISHHVSNSLAMLNKVPGVEKLTTSSESDEVFPEYGKMQKGFPSWVSSKDRKLLQAKVNETKFNLVVAKDGTGNFTTIGEALSVAPNSSTTRFVIHVTAGAYFENVEVIRKKTNLMFVGDGIGKTVVKGSRNVEDGWTIFQSATVAVVGAGFIAKGITFEKSAGPDKHQAVALRSGVLTSQLSTNAVSLATRTLSTSIPCANSTVNVTFMAL
ncbi:hypothetical protein GLYMA_10G017100v4 [Glycine max]|nr:hypothetical protein GLYMA_10G017100v4 [Glycine max]KAH1136276.1 hypothetical protein GYH30_026666 [Glycine max]